MAGSSVALGGALGNVNSGAAARLMMMLGLINIIKYIMINYPPNVIAMFVKSNGTPDLILT